MARGQAFCQTLRMPRYFFHVRDQTEHTRDDTGVELPDIRSIRRQAANSAGEILTSELLDRSGDITFEIEVEEANDLRLMTLRVNCVVERSASASLVSGGDNAG